MVKAGRRVINISRILHVHLISQYDVKPSISTFSLQVFLSFFFFFLEKETFSGKHFWINYEYRQRKQPKMRL